MSGSVSDRGAGRISPVALDLLVSGAAYPTPQVGFRWFFAHLQRSVAKGKRTLTPLPPARRHDLTVSPRRRARGIKREHGEDDPIGAETVAAPATVSGCRSSPRWSSDRRGGPPGHPGAMPLRNAFGRPAGRQMIGATSASQETCRQRLIHHVRAGMPGKDAHDGPPSARSRLCSPSQLPPASARASLTRRAP